MENRRHGGIRSKIILYTILCVVAVGLLSNLFLYQYMQKIISEKVEHIDGLYASTVAARLDYSLERALTLEYYCANSAPVAEALRYRGLNSPAAVNAALTAQDTMNSYLRTSQIDSYINKLMIFNDDGVWVNAIAARLSSPRDYENILKSEQYRRWKEEDWADFGGVFPSLEQGGEDCFVLLNKVYSMGSYAPVGYVYIELDTAMVTDILDPYNALNLFFLQTEEGDRLTAPGTAGLREALPGLAGEDVSFLYDGSLYAIKHHPLGAGALTLASCINQTQLQTSNHDILFSVVTVIVMIILIAVIIMSLLTHYVTVPVSRIMEKINRIALNDYSFNPELEKLKGEMGEIGARLNELGMGFEQLLGETIALHDEQAKIEMDLLQSQVNPHFLYNTLSSIHWMAVVQKNPGIEKIVKSLVSLLKNISKGVSDQITLAEELELLGDYISIQSIRYMGTFEYVCKVPEELLGYRLTKFTLQPLVENAIFHGIVPKGSFGTITVDAFDEEEFLVVTITDDGLGMEKEEVSALLYSEERAGRGSMSGIGVANVNRRLKLAHGKGSGLSIESVKGEYTRVLVRIRKKA